ncbi:MAG: CaiB/BaiF CoA-transferase family protein [Caldilineaceae bacterium]|uniref:CoA transferase n=1 Tax=Caldilineaceae bacterium SB0675_bin_29 TaxID=2605266 RepID=A0A6B1G9Q2_9CHLR|nr:CaiB/BaiF CoA-transferase family protein [Caldilineaceae bacterium]MYH63885.1 CoA transferase [Caldilineaceae bacterium SB0675_bin_29]
MLHALSHITVIDLSRVLAGPYATMTLGDYGAEVIKIEQPGRGDDSRHWGPPFTDGGQSAYFLCANRNKRSLTLNLKTEAGQKIFRRLAAQADVVVENFKAGGMERLGLGYECLRADNPGLVYCAITGYGQTGPDRELPGYDTVIQAQGGIMSITGPTSEGTDGEPFKVGVAIVDITAGLQAAVAILTALLHRDRTGEGQYIDIGLYDTQLSWLANVASGYLLSGDPPRRYGNAHGTVVPYQTFATADGHLMLAVGNDGQFASLAEVVGEPAWAEDERFATNPARVRFRELLIPALAGHFRQDATDVWIERLRAAGVPCGPVNDIPTALAAPQAEHRQMVQTVIDGNGDRIRLVGPVPKLDRTPAQIFRPPPLLGEHTDELLREKLALTEVEIQALHDNGVV